MCDSSSALHSKRQTLNVMAPEEVSILLELFRSHNSVLLITSSCKLLVVSWCGVNVARLESLLAARFGVLFWRSVVCFPSVCCEGLLCVRGERSKWRPWDPLRSWEGTPPIESAEAECYGLNKTRGLRALSLVHCLQAALGFLATRSERLRLHTVRREHKGAGVPPLMSWPVYKWSYWQKTVFTIELYI